MAFSHVGLCLFLPKESHFWYFMCLSYAGEDRY